MSIKCIQAPGLFLCEITSDTRHESSALVILILTVISFLNYKHFHKSAKRSTRLFKAYFQPGLGEGLLFVVHLLGIPTSVLEIPGDLGGGACSGWSLGK